MYGKGFFKCLQIKPFYKFQQPTLGLLTLDKNTSNHGCYHNQTNQKGRWMMKQNNQNWRFLKNHCNHGKLFLSHSYE